MKVKAYFGNGAVINASHAREGIAHQCPFTGTIIGDRKKYAEHLQKVRARIHQTIQVKNAGKIKQELWNLSSFEAIVAWMSSHNEFLYNQLVDKNSWRYTTKTKEKLLYNPPEFKFSISFLDLRWEERLSNTHSAPVGGVQNWGGRDVMKDGTPAPRGYPGWGGRIEFVIQTPLDGFSSDIVKGLRIHTGSGGSGNGTNYGYDVKFFDADWPELTKVYGEQFAMEKTMDLIAGRRSAPKTFKYGTPRYFK